MARMLRTSPLSTAMHEAGHAVARMALGGPQVQFLSIVDREPGEFGYCRMDTRFRSSLIHAKLPDDPEQAAMIRQQWSALAWADILDTLAGPIAELRWKRSGYWGVLLSAANYRDVCLGSAELEEGADLWQVRLRLRWSFADDPATAFNRAWEEAADLVAKHWVTIRRIGRQLHATGRLEADELEKVAALRDV